MRNIYAIIDNPMCRVCGGMGRVPNPLSRPKTWSRLNAQAFKLVSNRPNIERFPKAWARLVKFRNLEARYQTTRACPSCARRKPATTADVAKRLGIEKWSPQYELIDQLVRRGVAGWNWPTDTQVLYTIERVVREEEFRPWPLHAMAR